MKLKTLIVTVVILAAAAVGVKFATRPAAPRAADERVGQPLVPPSAVEITTHLKISDQGKTVEIVKSTDGSWRVPSYYDFPADFSKLSNFVNELNNAKIDQFVTSNPERLARLEFKGTHVELIDQNQKSLVQIEIGKVADAGGRFVRFGQEARAYRSGFNPYLDVEPKSWVDSTLLSLKSDDIAKIEFDFPAGKSVTVSRAKKEDNFTTTDAAADEKLKTDKISGLISSLGNLRFSDTSELADPMAAAAKEHQRSAKITTFDGKTFSVALGRKPEQKIVKPPAAKSDENSGPASLGSIADIAKAEPSMPGDAAKDHVPKIAQPETETIPAGPIFAFISSSDAAAAINALSAKRAFQVPEYVFSSMPEKRDDLFESSKISPPTAAHLPSPAPADAPGPAPAQP